MNWMIIDGNSILNRAFYGVRLLTNHEGLYTNAVYGFLTTMLHLQEQYHPDRVVVCFDRREKTFRHQEYAEYKGTRKPMPEELAVQLPVIRDVLDAMGITRMSKAGYEADDLLGTLSRLANEQGDRCLLVTGDKDSLQLVSENTSVLLAVTSRGQTTTTEYTPAVFVEKYGFEPIHLIDLKGLMGDTSDHIPGVPGIGEKTATGLVQKFRTVDGVYENIDDPFIKKGQRSKLLEGKDSAYMSLRLATIVRDVPLDTPIADIPAPHMDSERLYELFVRLDFSKLLERLGLTASQQQAAPAEELECTTVTDAEALFAALAGGEEMALVATDPLSMLCLQVGKRQLLAMERDLGSEGWQGLLTRLFSGEFSLLVHDGKPMLHRLMDKGIDPRGIAFDTALGAYLLNPAESSYDLPRMVLGYCNREIPHRGAFDGADTLTLLGGQDTEAQKALCAHAAATMELAGMLRPRIQEEGMTELYYQVELPLATVLADMQHMGFQADAQALHSFGELLRGRIDALVQQIYQQAGEEFNINSTKKLGEILFEKLELPVVKKTKRGFSTNIDVLEALKGYHPIVPQIIEYRQLTKLSSTYIDGLLKAISPDGRIHSTFQQMATATGRLSSTDPNLQSIPVRQGIGAELRRMFTAREGCVLVDADYSQIELRVLAHIAGDEAMIAAFASGMDFHTVTASQVFGVSPEEVTPNMRRSAKAVNFGIVYGISAFSLAQDIGVSVAEAKEYMNRYLAHYQGVRDYMERVKEQARKDGYVSTMLGRRRYLPELQSRNFNIRSFGERVALNAPIQGTAADIIKIAMVRVWNRLRKEQLQSRLVLQVHDELILEAPEQEAETVSALLQEEMENACTLSVPLLAEAACGKDWYTAKG